MGLLGSKFEIKYEKDGTEHTVIIRAKTIQEAKLKFGKKYGYISKVSVRAID